MATRNKNWHHAKELDNDQGVSLIIWRTTYIMLRLLIRCWREWQLFGFFWFRWFVSSHIVGALWSIPSTFDGYVFVIIEQKKQVQWQPCHHKYWRDTPYWCQFDSTAHATLLRFWMWLKWLCSTVNDFVMFRRKARCSKRRTNIIFHFHV